MSDNYANQRLASLDFNLSRDYGLLDTASGEVGGKFHKPRMWSDDDGNLLVWLTLITVL